MSPVFVAPPDSSIATRDFTKYDGYLDSLALVEVPGAQRVTRALPLQAVKQDTGTDPDQVRPEYGDYFAQSDFSLGAGYEKFHQRGDDLSHKRFLYSEGFDVSVPGNLRHCHLMEEVNSPSGSSDYWWSMASADDMLFVGLSNSGEVVTGAASWSTETTNAGKAGFLVADLASAGTELFAAGGVSSNKGINKRATGGVWADYITAGNVSKLLWAKERLIAIGGTSERSIYEITASGAALPSAIRSLPSGWKFTCLFENGPYIYAAAKSEQANECRIYHYGLNSGATAIEEKGYSVFPRAQFIEAGAGYLNMVFLAGGKRSSFGGREPIFYMGIPDDNGFLGFQEIAEGRGPATAGVGGAGNDRSATAVYAFGDNIFVTWPDGGGQFYNEARAGLAVYNFATGSFSHYLESDNTSPRVSGIIFYGGKLYFAQPGAGVYAEQVGEYVSSAFLITSIADWMNAGLKTWDNIEITHKPLAASTSVAVYYTTEHPDENSWTLVGTSNTQDSVGKTFTLTDVESRTFALKFVSTSNGAGTSAPEILGFSVRSHPAVATNEWVLERTFRIMDKQRKADTGPISLDSNPNLTRRNVENLLRDSVTYYEQGDSWNVRIEGVESVKIAEPEYGTPEGEVGKNVFHVKVTMVGSRN